MNINPCSKYPSCSASFCPATSQGTYISGDDVCPKTGAQWSQAFNKDCRGIKSSEAHQVIQRRFDKQQQQVTIH